MKIFFGVILALTCLALFIWFMGDILDHVDEARQNRNSESEGES